MRAHPTPPFLCCPLLQYLPQVASPVLDVWAKNVADPLISEDALSVLSAIAQQPPCLQPLAQQVC